MSVATPGRLFRELRRRGVLRVAALYIVGAWLVMQAADVFFPAWGIPDAALNYLLAAAVLGFPVVLVFGWLFDIGPDGIHRTRPAGAAGLDAAPTPLRRSDLLVLAAFAAVALAIVYNTANRVLEAPRDATTSRGPEVGQPAAVKPERSIAVLPFANMSRDPDGEYLCDGITEEILNRLAAFPELHVIARTSSFAFKDSGYDAPRLSGLLGVRYLLQGSVRRDGKQLRITAQLVDESGVQVWSSAYDRELRGIFAIQQEIAAAVASSVGPQIIAPPATEAPSNLEAYQHYLVGREIWHKRAPDYPDRAEEQFKRAIAIDPQYAEPYAELAFMWMLGRWGLDDRDREERFARAQQAIDRALVLKPGLARAHAAQGLLLRERDPPDFEAAEAEFRKALALDPNRVESSYWLAGTLFDRGRDAEGFAIMERASRIDPLASPLNQVLAEHYAQRGDFASAERTLRRLLELPEPSLQTFLSAADFYSEIGRLVEANDIAKRRALHFADAGGRGRYELLALSYARLGLSGQADHWLARHQREWPEEGCVAGPVGYSRSFSLIQRLRGRQAEMAERIQAELRSGHYDLASMGYKHQLRVCGIVLALGGDYGQAVRVLETIRDLADRHPGDADALHALAWAYTHTGATRAARGILDDLERRFRQRQADGWLHLGSDLALYAQNAVLAGDHEAALARLRQAVDAGWRDYYAVTNDPRWQSVRNDPRFQALMATVKADIEAQRAQVEKIDAEDDFVATLDTKVRLPAR